LRKVYHATMGAFGGGDIREMELPVLVAIISVSGTLLGTVIGGSIVTGGNYLLARRSENLEFRTACRLIAAELQAAEFTLTFALGKKSVFAHLG
jgi:hypothetical protein